MVCSPVYDYIYQFSEYVFAVETNRKVGFMNIKGEIVIPIEYDSLSCNYSAIALPLNPRLKYTAKRSI